MSSRSLFRIGFTSWRVTTWYANNYETKLINRMKRRRCLSSSIATWFHGCWLVCLDTCRCVLNVELKNIQCSLNESIYICNICIHTQFWHIGTKRLNAWRWRSNGGVSGVLSSSCLIKGWNGAKRDDVKSIAFIPEDSQTSNYAICA